MRGEAECGCSRKTDSRADEALAVTMGLQRQDGGKRWRRRVESTMFGSSLYGGQARYEVKIIAATSIALKKHLLPGILE